MKLMDQCPDRTITEKFWSTGPSWTVYESLVLAAIISISGTFLRNAFVGAYCVDAIRVHRTQSIARDGTFIDVNASWLCCIECESRQDATFTLRMTGAWLHCLSTRDRVQVQLTADSLLLTLVVGGCKSEASKPNSDIASNNALLNI